MTAKEPTASPWASLLYSWAPILLLIGFWIFFMRQMQSGGNKALSFGKSRAKLSSSSQKKLTLLGITGPRSTKTGDSHDVRQARNFGRALVGNTGSRGAGDASARTPGTFSTPRTPG